MPCTRIIIIIVVVIVIKRLHTSHCQKVNGLQKHFLRVIKIKQKNLMYTETKWGSAGLVVTWGKLSRSLFKKNYLLEPASVTY